MRYIVAPFILNIPGISAGRPLARARPRNDDEEPARGFGSLANDPSLGSINYPSGTANRPSKGYFTDLPSAEREALRRAEENPGTNYAVFAPVSVVEARKAAVEIINKQVNGSGELVVREGDTP